MVASIRDCAFCGKAFESTGHGRKYCDKCRKLTRSQRDNLMFRRELTYRGGPKKEKPITCAFCGQKVIGKGNQKYCPDCRLKANKEKTDNWHREDRARKRAAAAANERRSRLDVEEAVLLNWHDLSGKSLARVDAEAKAFGLSYGQYTSAVRCGSIDQLLRSRGIADPAAVLREIKTK